MKKIFIVALAALSLAACKQDAPFKNVEIEFETSIQYGTKHIDAIAVCPDADRLESEFVTKCEQYNRKVVVKAAQSLAEAYSLAEAEIAATLAEDAEAVKAYLDELRRSLATGMGYGDIGFAFKDVVILQRRMLGTDNVLNSIPVENLVYQPRK